MTPEVVGIYIIGVGLALLMLKLHTKSERSSDEAHAAIGKNIKGVEDRLTEKINGVEDHVTGRIDGLSNLMVTRIGDQVSKNTEILEKLVNKTH